ncbi:hypothetical protein PV08_05220 [Exophiala spinifera]|uniref:Uncharacterized protein n=1 Tax=Exophiala spinifera TaxID=91928 RepID=A0A0D2B937_9EURO|nr:uncharacterized protein PV08_05220 [Exophiala spinifera]KIW15175.1 hypothetical protein PV08_05220 [Exophiala spinifera]
MSTTSTSAESQLASASSAQRTAEAKRAFTASLVAAGTSIDAELEARAKNIHSNAKALSEQEDQLRKKTIAVARDADSLEKLLKKTKPAVDSLGDLDTMLADLEADMATMEETLRLAEQSDEEGIRNNAH